MFTFTKFSRTLRVVRMPLLGTLVSYALAQSASALEVTAGDYEAMPPGIKVAMLYYQNADRSDFYANGGKVSNNFKLKSNIGIARFIYVVKLSETAVIDPQIILPFGELKTSGAASFLGNANGTADLIIGAPVKFVLDAATRDVFSIGPYLYLPSGSYDSSRIVNLGENRWKALLQLAYIRHFNASWALDLAGDVTIHGKNGDFTPAHATLKQDPRYEAQAHLRYNVSPTTALSVGYGFISGAETEVNNAKKNDQLKTQYARLTATHFLDQTTQIQAQYGRDISVENGFMEKNRFNLRVVKIF